MNPLAIFFLLSGFPVQFYISNLFLRILLIKYQHTVGIPLKEVSLKMIILILYSPTQVLTRPDPS